MPLEQNRAESTVGFLREFSTLGLLFGDPAFALGILRMLDEGTRRVLFDLVLATTHSSRFQRSPDDKKSLETLIEMGVVSGENGMMKMDPEFRSSLLRGLSSGRVDERFVPLQPDAAQAGRSLSKGAGPAGHRKQPSQASQLEYPLELYATTANGRFHEMLQSIVQSGGRRKKTVREVLVYFHLLDHMDEITNRGFEFLLLPKREQMWFLVTRSIKCFARSESEECEMLLDVMELCSKRKTRLYRPAEWKRWYEFLVAIGIFLTPSDLANASGPGDSPVQKTDTGIPDAIYIYNRPLVEISTDAKNRYIVMETNYKIYAYTDKEYEKSVLGLFSKTTYTLPNMIKAQLDEESVCGALGRGITARQILKYLVEFSMHVPANIANQLLIWEAKQYRMAERDGVLYCDFLHLSDYLKLLDFLGTRGAVLMKDEARRMVVGTDESYEEAREFIKGL